MQAIEYARALSLRGIPNRMMPRPRMLEASCGTAVRFTSLQAPGILQKIAPVKSLYRIEDGKYLPVESPSEKGFEIQNDPGKELSLRGKPAIIGENMIENEDLIWRVFSFRLG